MSGGGAEVELSPEQPAPPNSTARQDLNRESEALPPPILADDGDDKSVSAPDPFGELVGEAVGLLRCQTGPEVTLTPILILSCLLGTVAAPDRHCAFAVLLGPGAPGSTPEWMKRRERPWRAPRQSRGNSRLPAGSLRGPYPRREEMKGRRQCRLGRRPFANTSVRPGLGPGNLDAVSR